MHPGRALYRAAKLDYAVGNYAWESCVGHRRWSKPPLVWRFSRVRAEWLLIAALSIRQFCRETGAFDHVRSIRPKKRHANLDCPL